MQRKDIEEPIYLACHRVFVPGQRSTGFLHFPLAGARPGNRVDIVHSEQHIPRLEVSMGSTLLMQKRKSLQGLLEDAICHWKRIADLHVPLARLKLWQLLDHAIHTRTHGLKNQALVTAIGAVVFKLV